MPTGKGTFGPAIVVLATPDPVLLLGLFFATR